MALIKTTGYLIYSKVFHIKNLLTEQRSMKKENVNIASPDELDKHLQSSSPVTWVVLLSTIAAMLGLFIWSCVYTLPIKLSGAATVESGQATLVLNDEDKDKLVAGEKVYILDQEGVVSFVEDKPVVSNLNLADGRYTYRTNIVIKEIHPIDYLLKR